MSMTNNPKAGRNEQRIEGGVLDLVGMHDTPLQGRVGWLKRAEDLVLGSIILALIALPITAVAIAIKVTSGGPIFFRQRRYGLGGTQIHTLRFRTTSVCQAHVRGAEWRRNEPPVTTRLGRFLRRTSLDELPQLLQVVFGELSLVGPGLHTAAQNDEYRFLVQGHPLLPRVRPGVTGWAQVNGWRGQTEEPGRMQQRFQHDLEYLRDWSLRWDLKILFLSLFGTKKRQRTC